MTEVSKIRKLISKLERKFETTSSLIEKNRIVKKMTNVQRKLDRMVGAV